MKLGDEFLFLSSLSVIMQAGNSTTKASPRPPPLRPLSPPPVSLSPRSLFHNSSIYLSSIGWLIIPSLHHAQVVRPKAQPPASPSPTPQTLMFPELCTVLLPDYPLTLVGLPHLHFPFKSRSEVPSVDRAHPHSITCMSSSLQEEAKTQVSFPQIPRLMSEHLKARLELCSFSSHINQLSGFLDRPLDSNTVRNHSSI